MSLNSKIAVGLLVVAVVAAAVWLYTDSQDKKKPAPPVAPPLPSTSGTTGLRAGLEGAANAACVALAKKGGYSASACSDVSKAFSSSF